MASFSMLFCFLVLVLRSIHCANITVQPVSINTTLNSTVIFTCEAIADLITFEVNDEPANHRNVKDKGFIETTHHGTGITLVGDLEAKAYDFNNNTEIRCRASNDDPPTANYSDTSLLLIQGLLASVGDLTVEYYINESSVLLSWTAPYTLDNVSITGYSINDNSSRILNTTELSFILSSPDPINPEVCDMTNVTVSAVNGAGIGQPANTGFYYKRVFPVDLTALVVPVVNDSIVSALNITVDVSTLCTREYPDSITVIILDIRNVVQVSFNVSTMADYQQMVVTGYTSVTKLPEAIKTFIINVSLDNRVKYNDIPSSVFGFLGPVTNINSSIDNCSNIYITWDSPRVDDDRVSIQHYLLTIYDNITGIIVDDYTVYGTSYQFEDRDLFIHRYTYIIAGVNELGEGTSNINTFSYQRVPRSATESTFEIFNFTENNATIIFNIPVTLECTGEVPENATISIECNEREIFTDTCLVEYAREPRNVTGSVSVPQNQECILSIEFSNQVGSSEPFELTLNTTPPITISPSPSPTPPITISPSPSPTSISSKIPDTTSPITISPSSSPLLISIIISVIIGIIIILITIAVVCLLVRYYWKRKKNNKNSFSVGQTKKNRRSSRSSALSPMKRSETQEEFIKRHSDSDSLVDTEASIKDEQNRDLVTKLPILKSSTKNSVPNSKDDDCCETAM